MILEGVYFYSHNGIQLDKLSNHEHRLYTNIIFNKMPINTKKQSHASLKLYKTVKFYIA